MRALKKAATRKLYFAGPRRARPAMADQEPPPRPAAREGEIELCVEAQPLGPHAPTCALPRSISLDPAASHLLLIPIAAIHLWASSRR